MSTEESPTTRYGVVACGKPAPHPLEDLGPCRLDPDHDGDCRWPMLGGFISVGKIENPFDADEEIVRMRRGLRRSMAILLICVVVNIACAVWNLMRIFGWV